MARVDSDVQNAQGPAYDSADPNESAEPDSSVATEVLATRRPDQGEVEEEDLDEPDEEGLHR